MKLLPDTNDTAVLRTDFTDDAAWTRLCGLISSPIGREGYLAYVTFVDDSAFAGLTPETLPARLPEPYSHGFLILADSATFSEPGQPLQMVDLLDEPGRTFRALPTRIGAIQNNLSLGNMGFEDFAESVDGDGIFRGFPGEKAEDYEVNNNPRPTVRNKKPSPPQTLLGRALFSIYKLLRGKPRR